MKNLKTFDEFINENHLNEAELQYDGGRNIASAYHSHETPVAGKWEAVPVNMKLFMMSIGSESTGAKALVCTQETDSREKYDWKFIRILTGNNKGVCYIFDTIKDKYAESALGDKNQTIVFPGKSLGDASVEIKKISDKEIKSIFDELVAYTAKLK